MFFFFPGEAIYCDDIPKFDQELYLTLVLSTKAHAKIKSIDASKALEAPGVVAFFSHKDLDPKNNELGAIFHDEEVFCSEKVCVVKKTVNSGWMIIPYTSN